jgi:hypothetical protein
LPADCETGYSTGVFLARLRGGRRTSPAGAKSDVGDRTFRIKHAWEECQSSRARNTIYNYLTAVFDLVAWWAAEHRAVERARRALRLPILQRLIKADEPFAAIIFGTSDQDKVDRRTRSKWSRVLRYAAQFKSQSEPLDQFVRRKGGINRCAARFTRRLGRRGAARA